MTIRFDEDDEDEAPKGQDSTSSFMEKALYEVRYELSHRPDWVAIPLRGLHEWSSP